jgi:hypothetical protein
MRYKLIGCEVIARPAYLAAAKSPHVIDMEFSKLQSHTNPGSLRKEIQGKIDSVPAQYDAVLLGYGLCGNSASGLKARSMPLVIPRVHDCCTIFLGGRKEFLKYFGQTPSAEWYTACYYERLGCWYRDYPLLNLAPGGSEETHEGLVEKYGEENARYIMETMNAASAVDFLTYIELPGLDDSDTREAFIRHAEKIGKKPRFIKGSTRLIDKMLSGEWNEEEFLIIRPGEEIMPVYDHDRVMLSVKYQE